MQMRRCTRGIIAALLVFLLIALFLDDPCFFAGAMSVILFLVIRYLIFFRNVKLVAASAQIVRRTDKPNIRQGLSVTVTTNISLEIPASMSASYEEDVVPGMNIDQGEISSGLLKYGSHTVALSYKVIPFIHGNIEFPGGSLIISDPFFIMRIPVSGSSYRGPVLKVYPYRLLEQSHKRSEFGGREIEQLRPIKGSGIRMYREYVAGDDVRNVDWKLSAKQDSLVVREYTGLESMIPLVIVDLPDKEQEFDREAYNKMVSAVSAFIERALKEKVGLSLLIISGPNMIDAILEERNRARYMNVIREILHPQFRLHHMYRMARKSHIRDRIQMMKEHFTDDATTTDEHSIKMIQILQKHLLTIGTSHFSSKITRTISQLNLEDIYLYSLCDGDLSHIQEIALQARRLHMRFRIRTPMINDEFLMRKAFRVMKGETIEGIA